MKKKSIIVLSCLVLLFIGIFCWVKLTNKDDDVDTSTLTAKVLKNNGEEITVQDKNNGIYTFKGNGMTMDIGSNIVIEYTGLLDKNVDRQNSEIISYEVLETAKTNEIPKTWLDDGIFSQYYNLAYDKLQELSLDEKIGQLFLVRYPDSNAITALEKYKFGGFVFFEKDFKDKTEKDVKKMIQELQDASSIPLLTAVDEEGGKVVRVSSNPNLAVEKFKSSQELYRLGGMDRIKEDTLNKSKLLYNLGLNLNLAPVVDVSTNSSDYMYPRTIGENTEITSKYAKTVIEASKNTGVSYTLKHFPGYGNNSDTHTGSSVDSRSYEDIKNNDLPPFKSGIDAQAEAVLVSHNIVDSIDSANPASLSTNVHNLLRNELSFTGIIITDDLAMNAVSSINDLTTKAIQAGNDLIITTDYAQSINEVKDAINKKEISEDMINKLAFRVLAWKYYKGLMFVQK